MRTFVVAISSKVNTDLLKSVISGLGSFVYLFDNVFLLNTEITSVDIRDIIMKHVEPNDYSIYVSRLSRGSAWSKVASTNVEIKSLYNDGEESI